MVLTPFECPRGHPPTENVFPPLFRGKRNFRNPKVDELVKIRFYPVFVIPVEANQ